MTFVTDFPDSEISTRLRKKYRGRRASPFMQRILDIMEHNDRVRIDFDTPDEALYAYRLVYEHNGFAGMKYRVAKWQNSVYVLRKEQA